MGDLACYPCDIGNLLALRTVHAVHRVVSFRFLGRRRSFRHSFSVEETEEFYSNSACQWNARYR